MASAEVASKDKNGKGAVDHAKEIKDAAKRAAVLALMAEYSVICAVDSGKADLVAAAVAKGCNVNETDSAGNTCLHLAVKQGSDAMVRMLLEADCNLDAKDKNDKGAVDCAKEIEDEEKRESVFAVLAEYVDVICAVASGKADLVAAAVARGCNVNETDPEENSCLHLAAKQASAGPSSQAEFLVYTQAEEDAHAEIVAMVRILLEKGAAVSAKDKSGYTALDVARNDDVKKALLAHGAKHSLTYAVTQGNVEQVGDLIKEVADVNDRFKLVGDFIKEHADVNAPFLKALDEKKTAMLTAMAEYSVICAVALGRADLVAAAVAKGCYVNETDRNSRSGLDYAARLGHTDIVRVLLQAGADFHSQRENGWSSLHHAAYERHADVVRMLVEAGASVNSRNNAGETPLSWAHRQRADVQAILRKAGEKKA
jgi:ankyrin repeat protein